MKTSYYLKLFAFLSRFLKKKTPYSVLFASILSIDKIRIRKIRITRRKPNQREKYFYPLTVAQSLIVRIPLQKKNQGRKSLGTVPLTKIFRVKKPQCYLQLPDSLAVLLVHGLVRLVGSDHFCPSEQKKVYLLYTLFQD